MPVDAKGGFHLHPGAAKMHDSAPKAPPIAAVKKPPAVSGQEEGQKGHIELHHGPNPDDGQGKYHTIHHPSGEKRGHASAHDAHQAINEHTGEDGCSGGEVSSGGEGAADDEY